MNLLFFDWLTFQLLSNGSHTHAVLTRVTGQRPLCISLYLVVCSNSTPNIFAEYTHNVWDGISGVLVFIIVMNTSHDIINSDFN